MSVIKNDKKMELYFGLKENKLWILIWLVVPQCICMQKFIELYIYNLIFIYIKRKHNLIYKVNINLYYLYIQS